MIAYAVHETGRREVIGLDVGEADTEAFWREFLRSLRSRGLADARLVVSDAHEGLKSAIGKVLDCPWQRRTMHLLRDMLGHVAKPQQQMVGAAIRQLFAAASRDEASAILTDVVTRLEHAAPKAARLLEAAEDDLLGFMAFPRDHWTKLRSTNPLERANRETARRSDVIGIYPNDAAVIRPSSILLIEQNDEWLAGPTVPQPGIHRRPPRGRRPAPAGRATTTRHLLQGASAVVAPGRRRSPATEKRSPPTIRIYTTTRDLTRQAQAVASLGRAPRHPAWPPARPTHGRMVGCLPPDAPSRHRESSSKTSARRSTAAGFRPSTWSPRRWRSRRR